MAITTAFEVVEAYAETYRATVSMQKKVDGFLDKILEHKSFYKELNDDWRRVNDLTEKFISTSQNKDHLTVLLLAIDGLLNTATPIIVKLHEGYCKQKLESIMEDCFNNLEYAKELREDIKVKISDSVDIIDFENKLKAYGF